MILMNLRNDELKKNSITSVYIGLSLPVKTNKSSCINVSDYTATEKHALCKL